MFRCVSGVSGVFRCVQVFQVCSGVSQVCSGVFRCVQVFQVCSGVLGVSGVSSVFQVL